MVCTIARARAHAFAQLLAVLGLVTLFACKRSVAQPDPASEQIAAAVRKREIDVAFAVVSDTHFGFEPVATAHPKLVAQLNGIEGRRYPKEKETIWPTLRVPPLRGLLITGDLTDGGSPEQWKLFEQTYGFPAEKGKLNIPTFEVIGNHDRWGGPHVREAVVKRHGGNFYSFDFDKVHFLALGEAPDEEGLAFAAADLAKVQLDVPLVLYFHLPLAGPAAEGWGFGDTEYPNRLEQLLRDRTVIAFFHGHAHSTDHYVWHGYDVFRPGAVKQGTPDVTIAHITDTMFTVAVYDYDTGKWVGTFEKTWKPSH